jgi:hypothetical protein
LKQTNLFQNNRKSWFVDITLGQVTETECMDTWA